METQFNIALADFTPSTGRVTLTMDLKALESLSANTTREYSRYFANMVEHLSAPAPAKAKPRPVQPPLPGL